jgi:DNA polymerase (family X)
MKTSRDMRNADVAKLLRSVSAALSLKPGDNRFRIIAYDRAADAIENSSSEVKDLWEEKELHTLPGVGSSIASYLDELFSTGKVKHFEEMMKGIPEAMFELMDVPGIGPKLAFKLSQELGIGKAHGAVEKLEKAAQKGRIRDIEGFGEESEKNILENIAQWKNRSTRILLPAAAQIAQDAIEWLNRLPQVKKAEPLGSLRRRVSTIGDIDIAVASDHPDAVINHFKAFPKKVRVIEAGPTSASLELPKGVQLDVMVQPPERFGALLQHFTGSKHHNVALREYALKKGLSLSERGIKKGDTIQEFKNEEDFYAALGMDWIPPELREDNGEIQAALERKLPELVKPEDVKGDLHTHSDFNIEPSHDLGTNSMVEMIGAAQKLGYEYIGFAEHNPSVSMHTPAQVVELTKRKREQVEQIKYSNDSRGINVLNGMEIDIKPSGELALPAQAFEYLDYAIVSIHGSFKGNRVDQTKRVLSALSHPKAKIFGHPTARKLTEREGVDLDWDVIFDFCLKNHKFLEINSYPDRLDLPDVLVRDAIKYGVKLIIDTDSHMIDALTLMPFGVSVARKGWAQKKDIINTLSWKEFRKVFLSGVE